MAFATHTKPTLLGFGTHIAQLCAFRSSSMRVLCVFGKPKTVHTETPPKLAQANIERLFYEHVFYERMFGERMFFNFRLTRTA